MNILQVDHIGIAVKSLDEVLPFYEDVLGLKATGKETVESQKCTTCFVPCGEVELELLESTSPDGAIARFIEKNGEGIQHIALRVPDINAALEELKAKGVRMIDNEPRPGAGGTSIVFCHPKATHGVLLELCEHK